MSLQFGSLTYTSDSYGPSNVLYVGVAKTVSSKDDLNLSRIAPKPTPVFSGVARFQAKLTRTFTLTGSLTPSADAIIQVNVSVPVGAAGAAIDSLVADFAALVGDADFLAGVKAGKISF